MAYPHRLFVPAAWKASPEGIALPAALLAAMLLQGCFEPAGPKEPEANELSVAMAVTLTRQAETATLYGAVAAGAWTGWTGTGYADYRNATGDYVRWTASVAEKGRYALRFRYANGATASRPLNIKVNGSTIASSLSFPSTGGWEKWATVSIEASLLAGSNTVQATATTASGGNIDYLQIYGPVASTTPTGGFAAIVSESMFNGMFPSRNAFYSYAGLVNATASYAAFANEGDLTTRKREAAAFLANVAHETGNLRYVEEINKSAYCSNSSSCPCASGQQYFGRGPIQLSWNYNYCSAGAALGLPLRTDPGLVSRDSKVAWQTGLWFWMTQSGAGYRPCHQSMVGGNGFGETIRTINGSLECNGGNPVQVQSRIDSYRKFCDMLGVSYGSNLSC